MNTQDAKFEELGTFKHGWKRSTGRVKVREPSVHMYIHPYLAFYNSKLQKGQRRQACARVLSPIVPFSKYSSIIPGVVQITRVNLFEYIAERR